MPEFKLQTVLAVFALPVDGWTKPKIMKFAEHYIGESGCFFRLHKVLVDT